MNQTTLIQVGFAMFGHYTTRSLIVHSVTDSTEVLDDGTVEHKPILQCSRDRAWITWAAPPEKVTCEKCQIILRGMP